MYIFDLDFFAAALTCDIMIYLFQSTCDYLTILDFIVGIYLQRQIIHLVWCVAKCHF